MSLTEVKLLLDGLVEARRADQPDRRWWDAMRDEGSGDEGGGT